MGGLPPPACASSEPTPVTSTVLTFKALVPFDALNLRLCHYDGLNALPRLGLVGTFLDTNVAEVQNYERQLNRLPPFPTEVRHCPNDDSSALVATFSTANEVLQVRATLTGCRSVSNSVHLFDSGSVIDELLARTKP